MEFSCKAFLIIHQRGKKKKTENKLLETTSRLENLCHRFQMAFSPSVSMGPSECLPNYYLSSVMGIASSLGYRQYVYSIESIDSS